MTFRKDIRMYFWKNVRTPFYLLFFREYRYDEDQIQHKLKNVPFKKAINYLKTSINRDLKTPYVWGYPHILQINPFLGCNLRCPKCPAHQKYDRLKYGELSFDLFKKFLDEVGEYVLHLNFWCWGEPFLNKNLPEMIEYAKSKKMIIRTSTNGNLLDDMGYNKRILLSGLDELIIALDGTTEETYLTYRKGGNFHRIIKGVEDIVKLKKQLKIEKPIINLRMVVTRYNEHEIPMMKELAERLGVDILAFKTVSPNQDGKTPDYNLIPKDKKYHCYAYDPETNAKIEPEEWYCYFPWFEATLFNDGTVVPCEYDNQAEVPFGNIKNQSFKEIWFGEKANQFRKQYVKDKDVFEFCKNCYYKGMIINSCVAEKIEIKK